MLLFHANILPYSRTYNLGMRSIKRKHIVVIYLLILDAYKIENLSYSHKRKFCLM